MSSWLGRDVLSLKNVARDDYLELFRAADVLAPFAAQRRNLDLLRHRNLVTAFYQASTRTRLSTEAAMLRLGGTVLGFADPKMTRAGDFYQESLADTVRMLQNYGDVIAMRHHRQGAPAEAAGYVDIPVINCGDGWGEHPTQVLGDFYTLWREYGEFDGITMALVGDLRMRFMRSALYAAATFGLKIMAVSPPDQRLTPEFVAELAGMGVHVQELGSVREALPHADVVYMFPTVQPDYTRQWHEPSHRVDTTPPQYRVTRRLLTEAARRDTIVLHPFPRMDELSTDVDDTPYQRYLVSVGNIMVARMALLALVLGALS
jgi:aspartate carbamoyltransferase catalytic subunit